MKVLDVLFSPWAIVPDRLIEIQSIYARHLRGESVDLGAIEARIGKPLQNEPQGYEVRNGAALIPVRGVISKRMNMFASISGGASTELLVRDVRAALEDPAVKSLVLLVDSPGGSVDGTQAAAAAIRSARGRKPIAAWSDGVMASAAYWIGSAADSVYIDGGTAQVGSIGVVATHVDVSKREEAMGLKTTEIVAGKYKRIASQYGPLSEAGRDSMQEQVDYLYSVFVGDVAANRGVSEKKVLADMADGRVFVGQQAVDAGLVDGITSLDDLIGSLNAKVATSVPGYPGAKSSITKGVAMTPQEQAAAFAAEHPEAAAVLRADGSATERDRIASVRAQSMPGHEALIDRLAADGKTSGPEAAVQVLAAEREARTRVVARRNDDAPDPVRQVEADPKADADKPNLGAADGKINEATDTAALDAAAKAYVAAHPGVDYLAALKIVQKGA